MHRIRTTSAVLGAATALALTSCATTGGGAHADPTTPTASAASCGTFGAQGREEVPDAAWACLRAGADRGTGAELQVTSWTTEGDPIVTRYRTGAGIDGIEVTTDSTADTFGPQVVTRQTCADLMTGDTLAVCADH